MSALRIYIADLGHNLLTKSSDVYPLGVANLATYAGAHQEGVYELMQTALSCFQGPTFAILLLGLLWPRCTPAAGLLGLVSGIGAALAMTRHADLLFRSSGAFLYVAFWSFVLTLAVCALVTPLTRRLGPDMNRDTLGNVQRAGFRVLREDNVYLDIVKAAVAVPSAQP